MAYEENEARKLILKACNELVSKQLIVRTWGNVSARVTEDRIAITPSGKGYDTLTEDDIVIVDLKGKYEGDLKPSSELGVHLAGYQSRPEANFIIHTHQTYASALSILGMDIRLGPRVSERTRQLVGPSIVCAEYGLNGSKKIAQAVSYALDSNPKTNHVLLKNHGAVCLGTDYDNAFHIALTLEKLSQKIYDYYCTDGAPLVEQLAQRKAYKEEKPTVVEEISVVQAIPETIDSSFERYGMWILHVRTPYVLKMSEYDTTVKAYLDDFAQITGPSVKCVSADADRPALFKILGKGNAVFVEGQGAYTFGPTYDEALCVAEILEKGCTAAYLARIRDIEPLKAYDAFIDRYKYVHKYSKLK
ncbi:MAG: class II aldolase/adducin family protein [Lachnospiraceae bacterium]|nr:class II aldolase/adducin family protein [Lachnospiraceae bacterium]